MSYGNLTYSDDLVSAFMTSVVDSFERQHVNNYLGRTAMQKMMYFIKELGAPVSCSFDIYMYGPYSNAITFAQDALVADEVLVDNSNDRSSYSNFGTGPNAGELVDRYRAWIDPHQKTIDDIVRALGKFNPTQLELIATLHFIHHRLQPMLKRDPTRDEVIGEFERIKGEKFQRTEVEAYYGALKKARLI